MNREALITIESLQAIVQVHAYLQCTNLHYWKFDAWADVSTYNLNYFN